MVNPFREVNWQPGLPERRKFAATLLAGFPCITLILLLAARWHTGAWAFPLPLAVGGTGTALGALLWIAPQIARPFYAAWYALACALGLVIGNALLVAIYLLIVTPIGLATRLIKRPGFTKRFDRKAASYWRRAQTPADIARYYRQF